MGQADGELVLRAPLPDEAQAVADVLNAVMLEERGTATETAEGVLNGWQTPGFDPVRHARLVFLPEGVLAGYVELWTPPAFPMPWSFGGVRPDLRGRGAGTALLGWAQQEALSSVAAMPAGP